MFHVEHPVAGKGARLDRRQSFPPPSARFLSRLLDEAGLSVPPGSTERLSRHAAEMLRWNRAIRLTAITEPEEVAVKHILDSLLLLHFAPFPGRLLDFGSGAGYPGIPLAIALPGTQCLLLESSAKKCAFLREVVRILSLENVRVINRRLERRRGPGEERYEQIVTRATLPPAEAFALLAPYLAPGGRLLLMGGGGMRGNEAVSLPAGECSLCGESFELPRGMGSRRVLEIRVP
ncbi:MAG: 16S rRNA (guanine(527)-N(7))-methyltransferase RsmG [Deltaproteobacteria bacterium]